MATAVQTPIIDVRTAVKIARDHVNDLFQVSGAESARLEEVDLSEDGQTWMVTVSIVRQDRAFVIPGLAEALAGVTGKKLVREFKRVDINATDGTVRRVVIRPL